jgi:hypothetical protein
VSITVGIVSNLSPCLQTATSILVGLRVLYKFTTCNGHLFLNHVKAMSLAFIALLLWKLAMSPRLLAKPNSTFDYQIFIWFLKPPYSCTVVAEPRFKVLLSSKAATHGHLCLDKGHVVHSTWHIRWRKACL